jgi:NADH-quinone oxidoreductase subunit L
MTVPLIVLAALAVVGGYVGLPLGWLWGNRFGAFLEPVVGHHPHGLHSVALEYGLMFTSVLIALAGIGTAYLFYVIRPELPATLSARARAVYDLLLNKYYVDEIYDRFVVAPLLRASGWLWRILDVRLIDGAVNGAGAVVLSASGAWRKLQTGNAQAYALTLLFGALALLGYALL